MALLLTNAETNDEGNPTVLNEGVEQSLSDYLGNLVSKVPTSFCSD